MIQDKHWLKRENMPSVTLRYSQAIVQAAERLGLPLPTPGADGDRVALADQDQLWQAFVDSSSDPLVGISLGQQLQVGHLDVAGMLLISCEDYGSSLHALVDYHPIVGEGGDFALSTTVMAARLSYLPRFSACVAQRVEAVVAAMIQLSHWSTGGVFRPSGVQFRHSPLDAPARYEQLLGCPVTFEQQENALLFEPSLLDTPLIQANAALREQLRELADQQMQALTDDALASRVINLLHQQPGLGKERMSEALGMSGRNLTRLLAEEGVSFRQVREQVLLQLAEQQLTRGDKVVSVATALGFSDESAFSKAFKRWAGISPARFREQCGASDAP